jgi:hypothetical protein
LRIKCAKMGGGKVSKRGVRCNFFHKILITM